MRFLLIIIMLFAFSALIIIGNNGLALYKYENRIEFSKIYTEWVRDRLYSNAQIITGEVVKLKWIPE